MRARSSLRRDQLCRRAQGALCNDSQLGVCGMCRAADIFRACAQQHRARALLKHEQQKASSWILFGSVAVYNINSFAGNGRRTIQSHRLRWLPPWLARRYLPHLNPLAPRQHGSLLFRCGSDASGGWRARFPDWKQVRGWLRTREGSECWDIKEIASR